MRSSLHFLALLALCAAGCETALPPTNPRLETLRVTMIDPPVGKLGTPLDPISPVEVTFDIEGAGRDGKPWTEEVELGVFLSYSGNKVGRVSPCGFGDDEEPLARVKMVGGAARGVKVQLVKAFGPAALWVEDLASHAVGASPVIYFPEPTIPDLNTPLDPAAPTATYCSPWSGRHVRVNRATGKGALIVTSVFGNAYIIADTGAPWDRGTDTGGYNHLYIFSFGRPPRGVEVGRVIREFSGNFTKFNGFSELSFPLQELETDSTTPPPPIELTQNERPQKANAKLLKLVSATVKASGKVCPINAEDDSWLRFNQFALDLGDGQCDTFSTFTVALPGKMFGTFNALDRVGNEITVTGALRNSSGQNEACKDDGITVYCKTQNDCFEASSDMTKDYSDDCRTRLGKASCVEGTCRRGAFNFWNIVPREPADIQ